MISYEALCEALDAQDKRRKREAEFADLAGGAEGGGDERPGQKVARRDDAIRSSRPAPGQPVEDTHEIDVDEVMVDEPRTDG